MSETPRDSDSAPTRSLGTFNRPGSESMTGTDIAAIAFSVLWLAASLGFFLVIPAEERAGSARLGILSTLMTVFLPVGMIWAAAAVARSNRALREESQRLHATLDGLRQAYVTQAQKGQSSKDTALSKRLDDVAAATKRTEAMLAALSTQRTQPAAEPSAAPASAAPPPTDQGALALGTPAEALSPPLAAEYFIRALNFPENAEDKAGFDAMRRALRDRQAAQLIQASQDVLTLLSQEGIYMDDLSPDMARPDVWRKFAQGTRGREVAALGGVHDRTSLALTAGRMKQDPIFRDAAHHFLRLFDRMFAAFEGDASDADISTLSETRTARAFMLLGRVAGTFD
ncbi:hypothetical protein [Sedimentitalea todarodis]|uniref:Uncharacterized protein n=1 Tax=Sedimentitalea todarodis TaxID=1631240 RepID=A0ABU3VIG6_9RHOB|nr:hypothetical protein [Sedimentitalea todarodis]MDU9005800.1 hypothetical protein [Sedimentitalea todarodis]